MLYFFLHINFYDRERQRDNSTRESILNSKKIAVFNDYLDPKVLNKIYDKQRGGVCSFLWQKDKDDYICDFNNYIDNLDNLLIVKAFKGSKMRANGQGSGLVFSIKYNQKVKHFYSEKFYQEIILKDPWEAGLKSKLLDIPLKKRFTTKRFKIIPH